MTKTKLFLPLFVILVMGMATSAFAQLNCAVASGTISRATKTGHAEQAGDISFTCVAASGSQVGAATITVGYPVIITNTTTWTSAATGIRITDTTGSFAAAGQIPTIAAVVNTAGGGTSQIVINVPTQAAGANGAFTLRGVLVSLVGATATSNLQANVSASPPLSAGANVLINSGDNTPTVITSIMDGIDTAAGTAPAIATGTLPALYLGNGTNIIPARAGFAITVRENYIDMFRSVFNNASIGATDSTNLQFTFSGMAAGSTIGPCIPTINTAGVTLATTPASGITAAAGAGGTATMTVSFTGVAAGDSPSQITQETVTLTCNPGFNVAGVAAASLPISAPITAVVTLAPTGSALSSATPPAPLVTTATGGRVPRYASTPISIGTVVTFTPATTTFLIPFVLANGDASPPAGVFDTGIALANTTGDPASFGTTALGAATDQAGTIQFTFFPSDGSASFSPPATASIPAGGSYIANASDLMKAAGRTGSFSGYVFAVANFTNGHGAAFVYGGSAAGRITSASEVLVLISPSLQSRAGSPAPFPLVEYTTK
jgi:hypothetical protein